jgi:hypothetical protein
MGSNIGSNVGSTMKKFVLIILGTVGFNALAIGKMPTCQTPLEKSVWQARKILALLDSSYDGDVMEDGPVVSLRQIKGKAARQTYAEFKKMEKEVSESSARINKDTLAGIDVLKVTWRDSDGRFEIAIFDAQGNYLLLSCGGSESSSYEFEDPIISDFEAKFQREGVRLKTSIDVAKAEITVSYVSYKGDNGHPPIIPTFPSIYHGRDGITYRVIVKSGAAQG